MGMSAIEEAYEEWMNLMGSADSAALAAARERYERLAAGETPEPPLARPAPAPKIFTPPETQTPVTQPKEPTMRQTREVAQAIAARFKQAREEAGWTFYGAKSAIAKKLGWSGCKMTEFESGNATGLQAQEVYAAFLNLNLTWARTGNGEMWLGPATAPPSVEERIATAPRYKLRPRAPKPPEAEASSVKTNPVSARPATTNVPESCTGVGIIVSESLDALMQDVRDKRAAFLDAKDRLMERLNNFF